MSLLSALDPAYYAGVPHSRTIEDSSAMQVSGHQAWIVRFLMTYPDGASQGLTWSSEPGAVVVVDRGENQAPAVFYVSVPANLGTRNVTTLIDSLQRQLAFRDADVAAAAVHGDRVAGGRCRPAPGRCSRRPRSGSRWRSWVLPCGSTMLMSPPLLMIFR